MNLGQLIDPERVQRGMSAERGPRQPAPHAPMGKISRTADLRTLADVVPIRAPAPIVKPPSAKPADADLPDYLVEERRMPETLLARPVAAPARKVVSPRAAATKPPAPPPAPKKRTLTLRMLDALAASIHPLTSLEVIDAVAKPEDKPNSITALLSLLRQQRLIEKLGDRRPFAFRITQAGRDRRQ
jgi:hypothetical protein